MFPVLHLKAEHLFSVRFVYIQFSIICIQYPFVCIVYLSFMVYISGFVYIVQI